MLDEGWQVVKTDYLSRVTDNRLELEDGSSYQADMTSGMLVGDKALLLAKHVRSAQRGGEIYTICAGNFDAWVTPLSEHPSQGKSYEPDTTSHPVPD
jgi:hypothetical protein